MTFLKILNVYELFLGFFVSLFTGYASSICWNTLVESSNPALVGENVTQNL